MKCVYYTLIISQKLCKIKIDNNKFINIYIDMQKYMERDNCYEKIKTTGDTKLMPGVAIANGCVYKTQAKQ